MADEAALNMKYFNENIGGKNINKKYKKTLEKENDIIKGRCYMNYISSNDFYYKPFIKKKYMFVNDEKKLFYNKLNINNYKLINDIEKEKIHSRNSETEIMKRILNILSNNNHANTSYNQKNKKYKNLSNNHSKYTTFVNNARNKITINNNIGTSFQHFSLPKIKNRKENIKDKIKSKILTHKNFHDEGNNIFRTSSIENQNEINNQNEEENSILEENSKYHTAKRIKNKDYSPFLGKSMVEIYKKLEDRENQSMKKSEFITNGIDEINKRKFDINPYDFKYGKYKIIPKKVVEKKYCLINLFKDLGKLKDPKEIEETLFNGEKNNAISELKFDLERKGRKRYKKHYNKDL